MGNYKNNRYDGVIGVDTEQQRLAFTPDSLIPPPVFYTMMGWTVKNFGPLYVPAAGDTMRLDETLQ